MAQTYAEIETTLVDIGFTNNEVKIYLHLLKDGSNTVSKLSKILHLNRSSVYEAVEKLSDKGLLSLNLQENLRVFTVKSPQNLKTLIDEKQEQINGVMPQLESFFNLTKTKSSITSYNSLRGIKAMYQDIAASKADHCVFGSEGQFAQKLDAYSKLFISIILKNKVKVRVIRSSKVKVDSAKLSSFYDVRYVNEKYVSHSNTLIYGDKVAIIIWSEIPQGIIIHDRSLAASYQQYFEFMWNSAK